jgi:phage terminase small subunit
MGGASYLAAGFKCSKAAAAVAANRLLKIASVSDRIAELQAQVAAIEDGATAKAFEAAAITKEKVVAELGRLAFANMLDYIRITPGGGIEVDLSRIERDTAAAILEVTVDTYVDGRGEDAREVKRVRFKLADKRAALVDLGKHLGLFVEPRAPVQPVNVRIGVELVDRPPRETFKQWEERRKRELAGNGKPGTRTRPVA